MIATSKIWIKIQELTDTTVNRNQNLAETTLA